MLAPIVGVTFVLLLGIAALRWLRAVPRIVPEEQRWVVYRLGRFHRVVGPGPALIWPRLDVIRQKYLVRDEPLECSVADIFLYGVPVGVTIRLWASFDLQKASRGDRGLLANLVQFGYTERCRQVEAKVREALIHQVQELEQRRPLSGSASVAEKILPLIPGTPECSELLKRVARELQESLLTVGAVLNTAQPVMITGLDASNRLIEAFDRSRVASIDRKRLEDLLDVLRQRLPKMSDDTLAQIATILFGLDQVTLNTLLLPGGADAGPGVDFGVEKEGIEPHLRVRDRGRPEAVTAGEFAQTGQDEPTVKPVERLTEHDLSVLKAVPRAGRDRRQRA